MITYPVSSDSRWDLWDTNTNDFFTYISNGVEVKAVNKPWARPDGLPRTGLAANLVPLLRIRVDPVYDPATHRLGDITNVVDVAANTSTYSREVIALTQVELDAIADNVANAAEMETLKTWYTVFKNGTATNLQAQRAIAWLIKQQAGI